MNGSPMFSANTLGGWQFGGDAARVRGIPVAVTEISGSSRSVTHIEALLFVECCRIIVFFGHLEKGLPHSDLRFAHGVLLCGQEDIDREVDLTHLAFLRRC